MSGDRRVTALAGMPFNRDRIRAIDDHLVCIDQAVSEAMLTQARLCDEADGIYRVSLDAAIEAAARALCEQTGKGSDYAPRWDACTDKEMHRRIARPLVTAAVMGGAQ